MAAITLGIVGHAMLAQRIGRNESFNHLGNMLAAIISGLLGRFVSYEAIFYSSIVQCLLLVGVVLLIPERDIDHDLARATAEQTEREAGNTSLGSLLTNRHIIVFTIAMTLFHLSNAALLPLVGQKMGLVDKQNSSLYGGYHRAGRDGFRGAAGGCRGRAWSTRPLGWACRSAT